MFTVKQVNEEVTLFNQYTSNNTPSITNIKYIDMNECFGKVIMNEILNNQYQITFANNLDQLPLKYQKSVVWHELTHIADCIFWKDEAELSNIMKSYSEYHASAIQLRFLLRIPLHKIIGAERRTLIWQNGETTLSAVSGGYGDQSITAFKKFTENKNPDDFNLAMNEFLYLCGYLSLLERSNADKLINHVLRFMPEIYKTDLHQLYEHCVADNVIEAALSYKRILLTAQNYNKTSC